MKDGGGAPPDDVPDGAEEEEGHRVEGDGPQDQRLYVHLYDCEEEVCEGVGAHSSGAPALIAQCII